MKRSIFPILIILLAACSNPTQQKGLSKDSLVAFPMAIQELMNKMTNNPNDGLIKEELIHSLDTGGFYKEGLLLVDQQIKNDSLNHQLWYQKARFVERLKDTLAAIRYYHYSIKLYPTSNALLSLANILAEKKDAASITICNTLTKRFPGNENKADIYFIKGIYFARMGNPKRALSLFDSCIYNNYRYLEAYMEKGFLVFENQQIQAALTIFETILKLDPLYTDGYYWVGKCFEALGEKDAAIMSYEKAVLLDPTLSEATAAIKRLK